MKIPKKTVFNIIRLAVCLAFLLDITNYCYGLGVSSENEPKLRGDFARMYEEIAARNPESPRTVIPGIGEITEPGAIRFIRDTSVEELNVFGLDLFEKGQGPFDRPLYEVGKDGVTALAINRGGEFLFVVRGDWTEVILLSKADAPEGAFPLPNASLNGPLMGVLLDLDGTCIKSEPLWVAVILKVTNELRREAGLSELDEFEPEDMPNVSGRTVPEHMAYIVKKYVMRERKGLDEAEQNVEANKEYFRITTTKDEMKEIERELLSRDISPYNASDGLYELLTTLHDAGVQIGFVTSGLFYKAWPELEEGFKQTKLPPPLQFLDGLMTAGTRVGERDDTELWLAVLLRTINALRRDEHMTSLENFDEEDVRFIVGRTPKQQMGYIVDRYIITQRPAFSVERTIGRAEKIYNGIVNSKEIMEMLRREHPSVIKPGTMGNWVAKPAPYIYGEVAKAFGFNRNNRGRFVVIGDSGSDVGSGRTLGVPVIGVEGGNIRGGGATPLCRQMVKGLHELLGVLKPYLPIDKDHRKEARPDENAGDAVYLVEKLIRPDRMSDRGYEFKYDASRLTPSQAEVVKAYVGLLKSRSAHPENIHLNPFTSNDDPEAPLITVTCQRPGERQKSERHVYVKKTAQELLEYRLKVAAMLNVAFASANIPDSVTSKEEMIRYGTLLHFIRNEHAKITGQALVIPNTPAEMLAVIKDIALNLPNADKVDMNTRDEFDRLSREALIRA